MTGLVLSIGAILLSLWPLVVTFGAAAMDFLFCPIHGIFAPQNWAFIAPIIQPVATHTSYAWQKVVGVCRKTRNQK